MNRPAPKGRPKRKASTKTTRGRPTKGRKREIDLSSHDRHEFQWSKDQAFFEIKDERLDSIITRAKALYKDNRQQLAQLMHEEIGTTRTGDESIITTYYVNQAEKIIPEFIELKNDIIPIFKEIWNGSIQGPTSGPGRPLSRKGKLRVYRRGKMPLVKWLWFYIRYSKTKQLSEHRDPTNVGGLILTLRGRAKLTMYLNRLNQEKQKYEIPLEAGKAYFVRTGIFHEVTEATHNRLSLICFV